MGKKLERVKISRFVRTFFLSPDLSLAESSESPEMPKSLTDFKLTVLGAPWELEAQKIFGRGTWMELLYVWVFFGTTYLSV